MDCGHHNRGVGDMFSREVRIALVVSVLVGLAVLVFWPQRHSVQVAAPIAEAQPTASPRESAMDDSGDKDSTPQGRLAEPGRVEAFNDLKRRARAGDAVAQRLLAETYDACYMPNFDRKMFFDELEVKRGLIKNPAQARLLDRTARERALQCDAVDGGVMIPSAQIRGWYAQAAENGDLAARLMDNSMNQKKLGAAESAQLFEEVLASDDPAAIIAMSSATGGNYHLDAGHPLEGLITGEQASWSWMVAACRMGYDCESSGAFMGFWCLQMIACSGDDFESFVKKSLRSDADRRDLERRVTEILQLVEGHAASGPRGS